MTPEQHVPEPVRTPTIKKGLLIAAAVFLAVVVLLWFFGERLLPPEATHKGKTVREWVELAIKPNAYEYDATIREIGAPAMPLVLRKLKTYESPMWRFWSAVRGLLPEYIQRRTPNPDKYPAITRSRAAELLASLAAHAERAAPELVRALNDENEIVRSRATAALAEMGPKAKTAIPKLRHRLQTEKPFYQVEAAWALLRIDRDTNLALRTAVDAIGQRQDDGAAMNAILLLTELPTVSIDARPILISVLTDQSRSGGTRGNAANALGNFRIKSDEVVSNLEVLATNDDPHLRRNAARALWMIDEQFTERVVAVATNQLTGSTQIAIGAAHLLGEIGPGASNAVDALTVASERRSPELRLAASNALARIRSKESAIENQ